MPFSRKKIYKYALYCRTFVINTNNKNLLSIYMLVVFTCFIFLLFQKNLTSTHTLYLDVPYIRVSTAQVCCKTRLCQSHTHFSGHITYTSDNFVTLQVPYCSQVCNIRTGHYIGLSLACTTGNSRLRVRRCASGERSLHDQGKTKISWAIMTNNRT